MPFQLVSNYQPAGDQPQAIAKLTQGLNTGKEHQILLGVTGSGKTYTIANVIAQVDRPTLVIAHNKTLAAQLCSEFREFFPHNAVEYFVSYYDYYQPEAYLPARDIYIEKEADINQEIERLRHSATRALLTRRDVIIVASVSCIYGLGSPEEYQESIIYLAQGQEYNRKKLFLDLEKIQYQRNDVESKRGAYKVKGELIDIYPSWADYLIRLSFFGDVLDKLSLVQPVTGKVLENIPNIEIFPAAHYIVNEKLSPALTAIEQELQVRLLELKAQNKNLEAERLEKRTRYDLEMLREINHCKGIENYSRHLSGRVAGAAPDVLIDFFPPDYLTVIDESHATIPQIRGMYNGDQARKKILIDYGFRLPSAADNRPLKFDEFQAKAKQTIYVSATPGEYELNKCLKSPLLQEGTGEASSIWFNYDIVEQVIRPTGLVDPEIEVKPTENQIDDLFQEIGICIKRQERVLITTITKQMAEDLCAFLQKKGLKVQYLHSEVLALDRIDILHDLRTGKYDVLIGVNLLREGLDLPEVSLVAIMDADKEGFLRNERSLIQTMGRAARNINGRVILYADKITESIRRAVAETNRRRNIQLQHNLDHNIKPQSVSKKITDIREAERAALARMIKEAEVVTPQNIMGLIKELQKQMKEAAENLEFELAAVIRDKIEELRSKPLNKAG